MPPLSTVPEPRASRTTSAFGSTGLPLWGSTGFGVAVRRATERGSQLSGAMCSVQLLIFPISEGSSSVANSRQSPVWSTPASALRSPSALNVPVNGPLAGSAVAAGSWTSSVPVNDWPGPPWPVLMSGTTTPRGEWRARDRSLMSWWLRLPMVTDTSPTVPGSLTCAMPA